MRAPNQAEKKRKKGKRKRKEKKQKEKRKEQEQEQEKEKEKEKDKEKEKEEEKEKEKNGRKEKTDKKRRKPPKRQPPLNRSRAPAYTPKAKHKKKLPHAFRAQKSENPIFYCVLDKNLRHTPPRVQPTHLEWHFVSVVGFWKCAKIADQARKSNILLFLDENGYKTPFQMRWLYARGVWRNFCVKNAEKSRFFWF